MRVVCHEVAAQAALRSPVSGFEDACFPKAGVDEQNLSYSESKDVTDFLQIEKRK